MSRLPEGFVRISADGLVGTAPGDNYLRDAGLVDLGFLRRALPMLPGRAACRDHPTVPPDTWHDETHPAQAVAVCGVCPVRQECLAWAEQNGERQGIWGGKLPDQRRSNRKVRHGQG